MFGPPSSPPLPRASDAQTAAAGLLPAFAPHADDPKPSREFLRPKFAIYQDPEPQPAFLPTPLPTSEANAPASSSPPGSPVRQTYKSVSPVQATPLQPLIVVRVPLSGASVTLGRSSKSSTFAVKAHNKLASRVHAKLSVSAENFVVIECLGWNGLTVSVPQESGQRQEYDVARGQILNVERTPGIIIEIHGDKALVEFNNDAEETEEESWTHNEESMPPRKKRQLSTETAPEVASETISEPVQPLTSTDMRTDSDKNASWPRITEPPSAAYNISNAEAPAAVSAEVPAKPTLGAPLDVPTTRLEVPKTSPAKEATEKSTVSPPSTSATASSTVAPAPTSTLSAPSARDSAPSKEQTPEPSSKPIAGLADTPLAPGEKRKRRQELSAEARHELENVAVNFIAFSRLSAVPLTTVRKASTQLQSLPKTQVREIIREIKCIGITDAERDDAGRLPEDEYYYIPELDEDESRRTIVQTTRGHRSLRSCRKTRKQYFYRPLNLTD